MRFPRQFYVERYAAFFLLFSRSVFLYRFLFFVEFQNNNRRIEGNGPHARGIGTISMARRVCGSDDVEDFHRRFAARTGITRITVSEQFRDVHVYELDVTRSSCTRVAYWRKSQVFHLTRLFIVVVFMT